MTFSPMQSAPTCACSPRTPKSCVELEHILSATDACHDHISMAIHRDETSKDQEREVMRLLQLATLQGFG
jgi:hypothetical protein